MSLWRGDPLVLASKSEVRGNLLAAAAIPFTVDPAGIDERAVEAENAGRAPADAALLLAREKALAVAKRRPGLVLGADQTLALGDRRYTKPTDLAAARQQLGSLAGRAHTLYAAAAVARGNDVLFETVSTARLHMRPLSETFLDAYLAAAGERVTKSVGGYQLEGLGIHLFEKVEGDHFTVLGLPLLPLLEFFRKADLLP